MEKQIKKLFLLAKRYVDFGREIELIDSYHNNLRSPIKGGDGFTVEGDFINVYFNDNRETWGVNFDEVNISGYSDKIEFPLNTTTGYLDKVYSSALEFLENYLTKNKEQLKLDVAEFDRGRVKDEEPF
jgi:hypothetical protein